MPIALLLIVTLVFGISALTAALGIVVPRCVSLLRRLRTGGEKLQTLFETVEQGLLFLDCDWRIESANSAALALFHCESRDQLEGRDISLLIPGFQSLVVLGDLTEPPGVALARDDHSICSHAVRFNGERIPVSVECRSATTVDGMELLLIIRDRTEQQQRWADDVHSTNMRTVGSLASGIAHEISTPTQYIGDNLHFMQRTVQDIHLDIGRILEADLTRADSQGWATFAVDTRRRLGRSLELHAEVQAAVTASQEGLERVNEVVRAARQFACSGSADPTLTDVNDCVQTTTMVARNRWKYAAEIVLKLDPRSTPIMGRRDDIHQALLELVNNAADAIIESVGRYPMTKGCITVETQQKEDWIVVRVQDTGCRISAENRGQVFDPFFTTKEVGKGTDQGLAIVYAVVVGKHNGAISVESEVGIGTVFELRLPVASTSAMCFRSATPSVAATV